VTATTRARRSPRLPLFSGQPISIADLRAVQEREMLEREIQRTLLADLANPALTAGPVLAVHIPNGVPLCGLDAETRAKIWRAMERDGARKGAADLIIGHNSRLFLLEVKTDLGRPSMAQHTFAADCKAVGVLYRIGFGLSDCRRILTECGVFQRGVFS
jgi:hypothetical protein